MSIKLLKFVFLSCCSWSLMAQVTTSVNCNESTCKHYLNIEESGFYFFSNTLTHDSTSGLWDFSIESIDEHLSETILYFGTQITAIEKTTAFVSFYLDAPSSIEFKATDYLGLVNRMKVKVFREFDSNDGKGLSYLARRSLFFQQTIEANETVDFSTMPRGHYLVTITSEDALAEGKLGVTMKGLKLASKITLGGELSNSSSNGNFNGYLAKSLNKGKYVVKTRFGEAKSRTYCFDTFSCPGASKPELVVKKSNPTGIRDLVTSSDVVAELVNEESTGGFIINNIDISDDGQLIAYSVNNQITNEVKVMVFDKISGESDMIFYFNYTNEDSNNSITDISVSGDGSHVAYAFYSITFDDFQMNKLAHIGVYDMANEVMNIVYQPVCGSSCSDVGPIENISFDFSGRYLAYEPFFDYLKLLDQEEQQTTDFEDLDFQIIDDMELSSDGSYLLFSSSNSQIVEGDNNGSIDVFIKNLVDGEVQLISVLAGGEVMDGNSFNPVIGANDDLILFSSNIGPKIALYLYDRAKGYAEKLVDVGINSQYSINESGQQVIFSSLLDFNVPQIGDEFRLWSLNLENKALNLKASSAGRSLNLPLINRVGNSVVFIADKQTADSSDESFDQLYFLENHQTQMNIVIK